MTGFGDARFWLDAVQWVTTILIGAYVWSSNRSRATKAAIEAVDEKHGEAIHAVKERVSRVEGAMDHLPDAEQVADLKVSITRAEGSIKAVHEKVDGLATLARSTQQTLDQLVENELAEGRQNKTRKGAP